MINRIKEVFRAIMNKTTAFMFNRYPEYVSITFLEEPVAPRVIKPAPKLNMGYNPRKRGPKFIHQFHAKGSWKYNPYFVSFLRATVEMDAFPVQFLNGKRGLSIATESLLSDLNSLGGKEYTEAFTLNKDPLIRNGIISVIRPEDIETIYINEWDIFIAAIDAYAMFDL